MNSFTVEQKIISTFSGKHTSISHDGTFLLSSVENKIFIRNLKSGDICTSLEISDDDSDIITASCFSQSNEFVFIALRNLLVMKISLKDNKIEKSWKPHDSPVLALDINPVDFMLVTSSSDNTLKIWNCQTLSLIATLKGHSGIVHCGRFHPSKERNEVYSSSADGTVRIWDLSTFKCVAICRGHLNAVPCLAFSPDGNFLLSGGRDKSVFIWNLTKRCMELNITAFESIECIASIDYNKKWTFWTGGESGIMKEWDGKTGSHIRNVVYSALDYEQSPISILYLYNLPESKLLRITDDHMMQIVSISKNSVSLDALFVGNNQEITDLCFLSNEHLAVASNSAMMKIYSGEKWTPNIYYGHTDTILCLTHTSTMLLGSGSKDKTARVWKIQDDKSLKCIALCSGHTESVTAVALSKSENPFLVTGSEDRTLKLWSIIETDEMANVQSSFTIKAHDKDINGIDVSPNDKLIVSCSQDKTAKIWNVKTAALIATLKGHKRGLWSAKFSSVDQCVITSSSDKTIKIWSLSNFACVRTFEGHSNSVLKAVSYNAGTQIVSVAADGLLKIWNIKTNENVATLDAHFDKIWSVTTSPNELYVASGGADTNIIIWKDQTEDLLLLQQNDKADHVQKEQLFQNLLLKDDFEGALHLSLSLKQPFRLLSLFGKILESQGDSCMFDFGDEKIKAIIKTIKLDDIVVLLGFLKDWNTSFKNSIICQLILKTVLQLPVEKLTPEIKTAYEAILPYTVRYQLRLDEAMIRMRVIDLKTRNI